MTLAWFRPSTVARDAHPLDDTSPLIAELQSTHDVSVVTEQNAHDVVWTQFRSPADLCVFELDNTPAHAFIWAYLLQYGGVLLLRSLTLHRSRAQALAFRRRAQDYATEFAFNHGHPLRLPGTQTMREENWPMLRVPLLAARLVVVPSRGVAAALGDEYPEARVRYAPVAVQGVQKAQGVQEVQRVREVRFGMLATDRVEMAQRAAAHARKSAADATLVIDASPARLLQEADVIVALASASSAQSQAWVLSAMAAGKPIVTLETDMAADWPALDPQTWRPRGLGTDAPTVVTIDPRDEEHSLVLSMVRLAKDSESRARLGNAARDWWRAHATPAHAAQVWREVLEDATRMDPQPRPADWPPHLSADGTERAREILREFGAAVDLF